MNGPVDYKLMYDVACSEVAAWRRMCGVRIRAERKGGKDRWFVKDKEGFPVKALENEAAMDHDTYRTVMLTAPDPSGS
jgi:hypothetical protein